MTKKIKSVSSPAAASRSTGFDPESSRWFTPVSFGILFLSVAIMFGEFLFSGKMLFMSDQILSGVYFRSMLVNFFEQYSRVPQWNPYIFGGMPYVDAFHGDIFYPGSVLKFFGTLTYMMGFNLVLHICLSGVFMYMAARQFALSKIAALLSGIGYMFSSYLVSLVAPGHDGKIFVTTLFPLVIYFSERGWKQSPLFNFSMLGLIIGCIILSPHAQMAYFTLWALALYTIYKMYTVYREQKSISILARPATLTVYAVLLGLLLSSIQFYPGYVYTTHFSPRADTKRGWEWATSWSMHEEEAMSLLIPEFSGVNTQDGKNVYWGKNYFKDNSESIGVTILFMGLMGIFFSRRRGSIFFGVMAGVALIYALGATTPVFRLFFWIIPKVSSLRAPAMIMFLFAFSMSLLAGMGLQYILEARRNSGSKLSPRFNYLLWGMPAVLFLLALILTVSGRGFMSGWASMFHPTASQEMIQQGFSKLDGAMAMLPNITTGAWLSFLFTAIVAGCIWLYQKGSMGYGILLVALAVPAINGMRFNSRFIEAVDPAQIWRPNPVADFLKRDTSKFRAMNWSRPNEGSFPYYGVEVVVGYHGNQLRWYDDLLGGPQLTNVYNPRFLNLAGTKYFILPSDKGLPPDYFGDYPVTPIATFGNDRILRNDNAFPRAYLVGSAQVLASREAVTKEVVNGTTALRGTALLEEDPGINLQQSLDAADSAWVTSYSADSIMVGVNTNKNALLVLTDTWYDSWHATVDGQPAKVLRAYGTFRAVPIPAGAKQVQFTYHSERYVAGRTITWLTSLYLAAVVGFYVWNRRRKTAQS